MKDFGIDRKHEVIKPPLSWYGARHTQILLNFFLLTLAYTLRVNLTVAIVAMTDSRTTPNPDIPTYDWNDKNIVLSSFYWGYAISQPLAGYFAGKYGPKWIVLSAMVVNSLTCILTPIVADTLDSKGVMGIRIIQGLFQGSINPSVHDALGKWTPAPERSTMGTFVSCGATLGTMLGILVTGLISASWAGWPMSFYCFGSLGLAWCLVWGFLGCDTPAEDGRISLEEKDYIEASAGKQHKAVPVPWRAIFKSKPVWALIVASLGNTWGYGTLLTQIPNYVNKFIGVDMKSTSLLSTAPYLACCILSFVFGPISDYLINQKILPRLAVRKLFNTIGAFAPAAALVALGFVADDQPTLSIFLLIVSVGVNAASVCGYYVNHLDLSPNYAGVLMSITNGSSCFLSMAAPLLVQVVVYDEEDKSLWRIIFDTTACVYVVSAMFFNVLARAEIQDWNGDSENADKEAVPQYF